MKAHRILFSMQNSISKEKSSWLTSFFWIHNPRNYKLPLAVKVAKMKTMLRKIIVEKVQTFLKRHDIKCPLIFISKNTKTKNV